MKRAAIQQASANTIIMLANEAWIAAVPGGEAADDRAGQDGDEGRALDQRVAGRQFGLLQDDPAGCRI